MAQFVRQSGLYKGIVIDTEDPAGLNRIKVRILELHGTMDSNSYGSLRNNIAKDVQWVSDDKLPWAEVCYPFGETTPPEINQVVWISFYGGDAQFPVVLGWAGYDYTQQEEIYVSKGIRRG